MVVYLPVALIKDWFCKVLKRKASRSDKDPGSTDESPTPISSPIKSRIFEMEMHGTLTRKDSETDLSPDCEARPLVSKHKDDSHMLKQIKEVTTKEIATFGFYLAPIWFVTEVKISYYLCLSFFFFDL